MFADSFDDFEYRPASEYTSEERRRHCWAVAIGLQDVDGLKVSDYLRDQAHANIRGEKGLDEVGELVRERYANAGASRESKEADLVSQRIAELLTRGAFFLSPDMLTTIHAYLFQDLDPAVYHPGRFKSERLIKQEEILNGDSVLYADPLTYEMSLRGAFANEAAAAYTTFTDEELQRFCHTIGFLWQIHPFYEGNTRTIAVFSELYLNNLGFQVTNDPFAKHARYFRDALVRAQYRNAAAKIFPDDSFLTRFYKKRNRRRRRRIEPHGHDVHPPVREPQPTAQRRSQGCTAQKEGRRAVNRLEKRKRWTPREQGKTEVRLRG